MARNDPAAPDEREALKKEIKAELRKEAMQRKLIGYGSCAALLLVAILVPTIYVSSVLARTGLVEVPVLTDMLYEPTVPTRSVSRLVGYDSSAIIAAVGASAEYNPQLNTVQLEMTEKQMTTFIAEGIQKAVDDGAIPVELQLPQIVITPEGLEFFARIPRERRTGTVLLRFDAKAENGHVNLIAKEFTLGAAEVPKFIVNVLLGTLSRSVSDVIESGLGGVGNVLFIDLEDGRMSIDITRTIE